MLTQNNHPTFINPPYPELKYACVPHIVSLTSILIERQLLVPFFVCSPIIYPFWFTEWLYTFHYTLHFNAIRCRQNSAYVTSHAKYTVNQNDVAHHWGFNASFNKSTQTTKKSMGKKNISDSSILRYLLFIVTSSKIDDSPDFCRKTCFFYSYSLLFLIPTTTTIQHRYCLNCRNPAWVRAVTRLRNWNLGICIRCWCGPRKPIYFN